MGLAKRLVDADGPGSGSGNHSFHTSAAGTLGWRAPEQVRGERCGKAVDLFAAGCILFFVLTRGRHPFGPHAVREANIAAGAADLSALEPAPGSAGPDPDEPAPLHLPEAADLVRRLIAPDPAARPPAAAARRHLCLFSARRRLAFLSAVSDRLCLEPHPLATPADAAAARAATDALAAAVDALAPHVLPPPRGGGGGAKARGWDGALDGPLLADLASARGRRYRFALVRDLLRAIRNKAAHLDQAAPEVQRLLAGERAAAAGLAGEAEQAAFLAYWTERFPRLCIALYRLPCLAADPRLADFFPPELAPAPGAGEP
jgi:serine/threonine-protein kinase/endoribonuclease IRE1